MGLQQFHRDSQFEITYSFVISVRNKFEVVSQKVISNRLLFKGVVAA